MENSDDERSRMRIKGEKMTGHEEKGLSMEYERRFWDKESELQREEKEEPRLRL